MSKKIKNKTDEQEKKPVIYGDPEYAAGEDIYSKDEKITFEDSDEAAKKSKGPVKNALTGDDLDVPGAELDDADEDIGEEDEENNYYSLGGEDHDDPEDDKGK